MGGSARAAPRDVIDRAEERGHVAEREVEARAGLDRAGRIALEVDQHHSVGLREDLAEVQVTVDALKLVRFRGPCERRERGDDLLVCADDGLPEGRRGGRQRGARGVDPGKSREMAALQVVGSGPAPPETWARDRREGPVQCPGGAPGRLDDVEPPRWEARAGRGPG